MPGPAPPTLDSQARDQEELEIGLVALAAHAGNGETPRAYILTGTRGLYSRRHAVLGRGDVQNSVFGSVRL
jgi:hypothetical protein